jgi:hypothetical protein
MEFWPQSGRIFLIVRIRVSAKAAVRVNIGGGGRGFRRKYDSVGSEVGQKCVVEWDDMRFGCQRAKPDDDTLDGSRVGRNIRKTYFGCQEWYEHFKI